MWSIEDDDTDDAFIRTYSYDGRFEDPGVCHECRPGGRWPFCGSGDEAFIGHDLNDCGGLCCFVDPESGVRDCSQVPDRDFGSASSYTDNDDTLEGRAAMAQQCKDDLHSACSCDCYGKQEGEFITFYPPPPMLPPPPPTFCPLQHMYTNKLVWDCDDDCTETNLLLKVVYDTTSGGALDLTNPNYDGSLDQSDERPWNGLSGVTYSGGVDGAHYLKANIDEVFLDHANNFNCDYCNAETFTQWCCALCKHFNEEGSWTPTNATCTTYQVAIKEGVEYRCHFFDLSTGGLFLKDHQSVDDISITTYSNVELPNAPSPPAQPPLLPPPPPRPSAPPGFVTCEHLVTMFCQDEDSDDYPGVGDGNCLDDWSMVNGSFHNPPRGHDCSDCGAKCCNEGGGCTSLHTNANKVDCDCFGYAEGAFAPVDGNVVASNRIFTASPSPSPPYGHCSMGTDHVTTASQGTTCSTSSSSNCSVLIDGATSNTPPPGAAFTFDDDIKITLSFPSPLDVNHLTFYHDTSSGAASTATRISQVSIQLFDSDNSHLTARTVFTVPSSGDVPLMQQVQGVRKVIVRVFVPTATNTISEIRVANRCANTPPSPPLTTCTESTIDLSTDVMSCYASSEKSGSHCNNVYDGVHDNLNSFFNGHGSDAGRSWVADGLSSATLRLTFTHTISFNYITIWQRLYHGLDHQVTEMALQLLGNHGEVISFGSGTTKSLNVATSATTADGESFATRTILWLTVSGVRTIEIILLSAMDPQDVGIAEIDIGTRCGLESPPPSPAPPTVSVPGPSTIPPQPTTNQFLFGLLEGAVVGTANLLDSNEATCSSYCGIVSPNSIFNVFVEVEKPSTWPGCRCFDPTTTTLRANSTLFMYGPAAYEAGLSLPTVATGVVMPGADPFKPVVELKTIDDTGIVTASSAFKLGVSIKAGASSTATFKNVIAVSAPVVVVAASAAAPSSTLCMPCVDLSSSGVRVRIETGGLAIAATATVPVNDNNIYEVVAELENRFLILHVTDVTSGQIYSGSYSLIFSGTFSKMEPLVVFAGKTVDNVGVDTGASVDFDTFSYTQTLNSHQVASFQFEAGHRSLNAAKFQAGFTAPPLFQSSLAYPASFSTIATFAGESACFDGNSGLVVNSDISSFWTSTATSGVTMCTSAKLGTQTTLAPTLITLGPELVFDLYLNNNRIAATVNDIAHDTSGAGELQQNEKTHVCMSISTNNELIFYRNASRILQKTANFEGVAASSKIGLGSNPFSGGGIHGFVGCLESVRVWSRVLSDAEVRSVAAAAA